MSVTHTPNFFVVGAPKSGTTSLCKYLEQHPGVFVSPIKEPCFFAPEVKDFTEQTRARAREGAFVLEWDAYLRLFDGVRDQTAIGEGSVSYLSSAAAPRAIAERISQARIIMVLRDPVDRLFSHYVAARVAGTARVPFVRWVREQCAIEAARTPRWGPVWPGCYATHLRRYLEVFAPDRVRVHLYEDFLTTPDAVYRDLLVFLGVDATRTLDATTKHNVTRVPRLSLLVHPAVAPLKRIVRRMAPAAMVRSVNERLLTTRRGPRADERRELIGLYAEEILALQTLIGRDLSSWLDAGRAVA